MSRFGRNGGAERSLGEIVAEVSEKASILVREEIELAKTEVTTKAKTLARGAAVGAAAGVFLALAAIFLLHALAYFFQDLLDTQVWVGYLIVVAILVLVGVVAGLLAKKWLGGGAPTPDLAIEEAKITRETLERSVDPDPLPRPAAPAAQPETEATPEAKANPEPEPDSGSKSEDESDSGESDSEDDYDSDDAPAAKPETSKET
jgi:hypothetical protein